MLLTDLIKGKIYSQYLEMNNLHNINNALYFLRYM